LPSRLLTLCFARSLPRLICTQGLDKELIANARNVSLCFSSRGGGGGAQEQSQSQRGHKTKGKKSKARRRTYAKDDDYDSDDDDDDVYFNNSEEFEEFLEALLRELHAARESKHRPPPPPHTHTHTHAAPPPSSLHLSSLSLLSVSHPIVRNLASEVTHAQLLWHAHVEAHHTTISAHVSLTNGIFSASHTSHPKRRARRWWWRRRWRRRIIKARKTKEEALASIAGSAEHRVFAEHRREL
jgi:hypothetical protein